MQSKATTPYLLLTTMPVSPDWQQTDAESSHHELSPTAYFALKITVGRIIRTVAPLSHHHSELTAWARNDPEGQVPRSRLPGLEN